MEELLYDTTVPVVFLNKRNIINKITNAYLKEFNKQPPWFKERNDPMNFFIPGVDFVEDVQIGTTRWVKVPLSPYFVKKQRIRQKGKRGRYWKTVYNEANKEHNKQERKNILKKVTTNQMQYIHPQLIEFWKQKGKPADEARSIAYRDTMNFSGKLAPTYEEWYKRPDLYDFPQIDTGSGIVDQTERLQQQRLINKAGGRDKLLEYIKPQVKQEGGGVMQRVQPTSKNEQYLKFLRIKKNKFFIP